MDVRSASLCLLFLPLTLPSAARGAHPGQVTALVGATPNGAAGSVLCGNLDTNGDSASDLVVGSATVPTLYLVPDAAGATGTRPLESNAVQFVLDSTQPTLSLATDDLNGDGLADLFIGLPNAGDGGMVAIFLGTANWPNPQSIPTDADYLVSLSVAGAELGASLATGPRPGSNGSRDLLIGAPGLNQGSGAVFRVPFSSFGVWSSQEKEVVDLSDFTWITTGGSGARLGEHVAAVGDLDGDGTTDFVMGAPGAATGGEVYLHLSSQDLSNESDLEDYPSYESVTSGSELGTAVVGPGDVDGDGLDDLLVGAPGSDQTSSHVYLIPGAPSPAPDVAVFVDAWMILNAQPPGEYLGAAMTGVPDVDGDGRPELLVGAPGAHEGAGLVGFFLSSGNLAAHDALDDADVLLEGAGPGAALGTAITGGAVSFVAAPGEPLDLGSGTIYGLDLPSLAIDGDNDGFSVLEGDCDGQDPLTYPGADEICDGKDNDCNGSVGLEELDDDHDGIPACSGPHGAGDCDDGDPAVYPGAPEICDGKDNDCNGTIPDNEIDADADGYFTCGNSSDSYDCDDNDAAVHPGALEICDGKDNDCDGTVPADEIDTDGDGYFACTASTLADCDDTDPVVYPGADEICDGKDNDCDGRLSDMEEDADGDGYPGCPLGGLPEDCDDTDPVVYPGADEICDGKDNDCDDVVPADEQDQDQDGYLICTNDTQPESDCDDTDGEVFPGAPERCDGKDNDCDGIADADLDGDGFRDCNDPEHPELTDCDDNDPDTYPGATEVCDGKDNDCDGTIPVDEQDADGDGVWLCSAGGIPDCDDTDPARYPGADEICDGKDNDCDGQVGTGETDADADGHFACPDGGSDCDDADPLTYQGADEACDGKDNDCDGVVPEDESDQDGDTFRVCHGDCDDTSPVTYPGADEICDGLDNDCDGEPAATENEDRDSDGYTACGGDCDDTNPRIHPGADEVFDGKDNDCNGAVDDVPCVDIDGDGYPREECEGSFEVDCNDFDDTVYPGASEGVRLGGPGSPLEGDNKDNDCDGTVDEGTTFYDDDGDGWSEVAGDCDDSDPDISPSETEILGDHVDNDCDNAVDYDDPHVDNDGDGYANVDAGGNPLDCDDSDLTVNPGATEGSECDDVDNNCNGEIDEGLSCSDDDGDGYSEDDGDCNDALPEVYPGADEVDDGLDNNCDGHVDESVAYAGPGIGCGAMSEVSGVTFSCSTGTSAPPSGSLGGMAVLLLAASSVLTRSRRR